MTEVTFHFNVPDKLGYACRLLRKARSTGAKVVVTGESGSLAALDTALWTFSPTDFIPHCQAEDAPPEMLARSPVVLAASVRGTPHHEVLVNLSGAVPEGFERFERLIELVADAEEDRQQGRLRWKHYRHRGYAVEQYDVAKREAR